MARGRQYRELARTVGMGGDCNNADYFNGGIQTPTGAGKVSMASILFLAFMLALFLYTWKEARRFRREGGIRQSDGWTKEEESVIAAMRHGEFVHEDCGTVLTARGFCPHCALTPDMQSLYFRKGKGEQDDGE